MLYHDRLLTISAAGNRRAASWPAQRIYWSEMIQRLATPTRGQETHTEYLRLSKAKQDELKDVGGFVAGTLANNRRKGKAVTGRDIITLDIDNIPAMGTDEALRRVDGLGCAYCVYSTRKHAADRPRLRVLLPLSRTVTADEYEPIARKLAEMITINWCDPTTFQAVRMMYWPSVCSDGQYVYLYGDKPFVDADGVLALYANWRDAGTWPQVPGIQKAVLSQLAKQEDPTAKSGIVGAFCRTYNVYQAMDEFLMGVYEPVDNSEGRYTFTGGSTTGGAVVYDDGKFLYSHHATDPAGGKLVNSFDLVRLHKFSDLDDEAKDGTPTVKMPSYEAMQRLAVQDKSVALLLNKERLQEAQGDFETPPADDENWMLKLDLHPKTAMPLKTRENVKIILENDPKLKGKVAYDEFANRVVVLEPLPWDKDARGRRPWKDADEQLLRVYLEKTYSLDTPNKILDAFAAVTLDLAYNDVQAYIKGLRWDGVARLDTLLIDYLNAEDNAYTRAVTRKIFTAAVARAMQPGIKFDYSLILVGIQGKGKSTLLRTMGGRWFLEDLPPNLEGKEASERIQGFWLAEMGELNSLTRSEANIAKQFLSRTVDVYREPYGRHTREFPRKCVIFGSTNDDEFLRDSTGDRRFWPVTLKDPAGKKNVFVDLPAEVEQVWAEAVTCWQLGEPLYLSPELEAMAKVQQTRYKVGNVKEGLIQDFVDRPIPGDWDKRDVNSRKLYWSNEFQRQNEDANGLEFRRYVCAIEVWCECLGQDRGRIQQKDTREINDILKQLDGWVPAGPRPMGVYGVQRAFKRSLIDAICGSTKPDFSSTVPSTLEFKV